MSARRASLKQWIGRGERIRTSGLYVPNVALYQAKLHPDCCGEGRRPIGFDLPVGSQEERPTERIANFSRAFVHSLSGRHERHSAAHCVSFRAASRVASSAPLLRTI